MSQTRTRQRKTTPKRVLALPDLEQATSAVLASLTSASGQRTYDHAIREFVGWYCSEPRLAFNRTVLLRYRFRLEQSAGRDPRSALRDFSGSENRASGLRPSDPSERGRQDRTVWWLMIVSAFAARQSALSAASGSVRPARAAGISAASTPALNSAAAPTARLAASVGATP
jgi:hypothetical protein